MGLESVSCGFSHGLGNGGTGGTELFEPTLPAGLPLRAAARFSCSACAEACTANC